MFSYIYIELALLELFVRFVYGHSVVMMGCPFYLSIAVNKFVLNRVNCPRNGLNIVGLCNGYW